MYEIVNSKSITANNTTATRMSDCLLKNWRNSCEEAPSFLLINKGKKAVTPKNSAKNRTKFTTFDFKYPNLKSTGKYMPVIRIKANNAPIMPSSVTGYALKGSSNAFMMPVSRV